jgi:hypothetical protein
MVLEYFLKKLYLIKRLCAEQREKIQRKVKENKKPTLRERKEQ